MKSKPAKTPIQERAALRANEERRAKHAFDTLNELAGRHLTERDQYELYSIYHRLETVIRNQHITDEAFKNFKNSGTVPEDF